jgi:hypothetical protein
MMLSAARSRPNEPAVAKTAARSWRRESGTRAYLNRLSYAFRLARGFRVARGFSRAFSLA